MTYACVRTWLCIRTRAQTDTHAPTHICCHRKTFKTPALQRDLPAGLEAREAVGVSRWTSRCLLPYYGLTLWPKQAQDKLQHIMWWCTAPLTTPSGPVGSPKRGTSSATSQTSLGGGVWNRFRHLLALIRCGLAFFRPVLLARFEVICNARCKWVVLLFTSRILKAERALLYSQGSGIFFHIVHSYFFNLICENISTVNGFLVLNKYIYIYILF